MPLMTASAPSVKIVPATSGNGKKSGILAPAFGAAGGFLVGGPVGAAIGFGAGLLLSKKKVSSPASEKPRPLPMPLPTGLPVPKTSEVTPYYSAAEEYEEPTEEPEVPDEIDRQIEATNAELTAGYTSNVEGLGQVGGIPTWVWVAGLGGLVAWAAFIRPKS